MENKGLQYLTLEAEKKEIQAVLGRDLSPLKLQYLQGSKKKGLALWNVLSPQLPGYAVNGGTNGYPTFSVMGLAQHKLIPAAKEAI